MDKYFKVKTGAGNSGINSNAGYYGCTLIAIVSLHSSSGNNTYSQIDMIRCGYSDNHIEVVNISKSTGGTTSVISYSLDSDGFIQVSSNNNPQTMRVLFIANRAI